MTDQSGQSNHEVERGGFDVGDQSGADLPAEARAVDPRAELVQPPLVDLTGVERHVEATQARVRGGSDEGDLVGPVTSRSARCPGYGEIALRI